MSTVASLDHDNPVHFSQGEGIWMGYAVGRDAKEPGMLSYSISAGTTPMPFVAHARFGRGAGIRIKGDAGFLLKLTKDLVAVDRSAKSLTFCGFSGKPNLISQKVNV